jgi:hypothetical protein
MEHEEVGNETGGATITATKSSTAAAEPTSCSFRETSSSSTTEEISTEKVGAKVGRTKTVLTARIPLTIIFDIDGTLIAQSRHIRGIRIRPGAVEFIHWCRKPGHFVALWTKAPAFWANQVSKKFSTLIHPGHSCKGGHECRKTFDFCWDGSRVRRQRYPSKTYWGKSSSVDEDTQQVDIRGCLWCDAYSEECHECECWSDECPYQSIKDLRTVWFDGGKETQNFVKERTLIVEDAPQNCIFNYGNDVYVPTYGGSLKPYQMMFEKLQVFVEETLEVCENVRQVPKCAHGKSYHACCEQSWLS